MSLRSDDLDSVGEFYTENDFRQLVVTIKTPPAFLGGLGELEDHVGRALPAVAPMELDKGRGRATMAKTEPLSAMALWLGVFGNSASEGGWWRPFLWSPGWTICASTNV